MRTVDPVEDTAVTDRAFRLWWLLRHNAEEGYGRASPGPRNRSNPGVVSCDRQARQREPRTERLVRQRCDRRRASGMSGRVKTPRIPRFAQTPKTLMRDGSVSAEAVRIWASCSTAVTTRP